MEYLKDLEIKIIQEMEKCYSGKITTDRIDISICCLNDIEKINGNNIYDKIKDLIEGTLVSLNSELTLSMLLHSLDIGLWKDIYGNSTILDVVIKFLSNPSLKGE